MRAVTRRCRLGHREPTPHLDAPPPVESSLIVGSVARTLLLRRWNGAFCQARIARLCGASGSRSGGRNGVSLPGLLRRARGANGAGLDSNFLIELFFGGGLFGVARFE